jgi:hypothetical protein
VVIQNFHPPKEKRYHALALTYLTVIPTRAKVEGGGRERIYKQ